MECRIDGAVTPPGLIAGAKTFSLILRDEGLYVIHTGPAKERPLDSQLQNNSATQTLKQQVAKTMTEGETRLNETGSGALVQQKHSKLLATDQISAINIKENLREIVLEIRSSQGKYKFRVPPEDKAAAETLKQALRLGSFSDR
jgi:hypothetical protein